MTATDTAKRASANADYSVAMHLLNGRKHRKVANNTYARLEDDGRIVVKLHDTDILTYHPNGEVEYQSGGWLTPTTKERMNSFGARGVIISQDKGRWFVYGHKQWSVERGLLSDYYDGLRIRDGQVTTKVAHAVDPDKKIKAAIDRYVKGYTDEEIKRLVEKAQEHGTAGDCFFCGMQTEDGTPLGEAQGDHSHLREHVKENYRMVTLAYNAVKAAGSSRPEYVLHYMPDRARTAIKRYLRQRLATNTAGAAGGPKPRAEHWDGR